MRFRHNKMHKYMHVLMFWFNYKTVFFFSEAYRISRTKKLCFSVLFFFLKYPCIVDYSLQSIVFFASNAKCGTLMFA